MSASLFSHGAEGGESSEQTAEQLAGLSMTENEEPKLFIGNLSWSVTTEELETYLSQAGTVSSCEVKRNYNGQSKGFALATFSDVAGADNAISMLHDVEMQGRRLIVRYDSKPEDRPSFRNRRSDTAGATNRRGRREEPPPCERIFCGNLPFSTSEEDFEQIFAGSGAVSTKLITDDSGQSKGYGIVTFTNIDAAADAISKFHNYSVDGRLMRCKFDQKPPK